MTVKYSNYEAVRRYYDTTGTALYGHATKPTEMWNIDRHNFRMSAMFITAPYLHFSLTQHFSI